MINSVRKIIDQLLPYRQHQKDMRESWNHKLLPSLIVFYHYCFVVSEGIIAPNIHYSYSKKIAKKLYCALLMDLSKASALLMDLSKAFDCLNHDLMIAKLNAYGFSRSALNFTLSYLSQRKQRVKINGSFSEWKTTSVGVPQGSVLGPLLFNIYKNEMFISNSQICNYADDTTLYVIH